MAQRGRIRPRAVCIVQSVPPACLFHYNIAMNTPAIITGPWLLAQLSEGPYVPPALPAPPRLAHYLFENPWPLAIFLLVVAVLLLFIGTSRGRAREGALLAGAFAGIAAACIAVSFLVTTERERLRVAMRGLIAATATADTTPCPRCSPATLRSMFSGGSSPRTRMASSAWCDATWGARSASATRVARGHAYVDGFGPGRRSDASAWCGRRRHG